MLNPSEETALHESYSLVDSKYTLHINKQGSEKLWNSLRYIYLHGRIGEVISLTVNTSSVLGESTFNARVEGLEGERVYLSIPFEQIVKISDSPCQ